MLPSIFEKHKICSNPTKSLLIIQYYQQKKRGFCDGTASCYLTSPFVLQCYKHRYNSVKIIFDLWLINEIDLHYRHGIKISFIKKEHVHTLNSKKLKIS